MTTPTDWLRTIQHTASILPDIVEGQPVSIADLHKAAAVSGWIADADRGVVDGILDCDSNIPTDTLADMGRLYLAAALRRLNEQEQQ